MLTHMLVGMPSPPLSPEQKADAARLRAAFLQWQEDEDEAGRPYSQAEAAFKLGFGQSALSQYLRGFIPLNANALSKFCRLMGIKPIDISPSIVEEERRRAMAWYETPGEAPAAPPKVASKKALKTGALGAKHRAVTGKGLRTVKVKVAKNKGVKSDAKNKSQGG